MKKLASLTLGILTAVGAFIDIGDLVTDALPLLHDASSLLAEVRIAAYRGDLMAVGDRTEDLEALAGRLEQRVRELRP